MRPLQPARTSSPERMSRRRASASGAADQLRAARSRSNSQRSASNSNPAAVGGTPTPRRVASCRVELIAQLPQSLAQVGRVIWFVVIGPLRHARTCGGSIWRCVSFRKVIDHARKLSCHVIRRIHRIRHSHLSLHLRRIHLIRRIQHNRARHHHALTDKMTDSVNQRDDEQEREERERRQREEREREEREERERQDREREEKEREKKEREDKEKKLNGDGNGGTEPPPPHLSSLGAFRCGGPTISSSSTSHSAALRWRRVRRGWNVPRTTRSSSSSSRRRASARRHIRSPRPGVRRRQRQSHAVQARRGTHRGFAGSEISEEELTGRRQSITTNRIAARARAHVRAEPRRPVDAFGRHLDRVQPREHFDRASRLADAARSQCRTRRAHQARRLFEAARAAGLDKPCGRSEEMPRTTSAGNQQRSSRRPRRSVEPARRQPVIDPGGLASEHSARAARAGTHSHGAGTACIACITSPLAPARWLHALAPVTHRAWTELWHTRLSHQRKPVGRRRREPYPRNVVARLPSQRQNQRAHRADYVRRAAPPAIRRSRTPISFACRSIRSTARCWSRLMAGYDATVEGGGCLSAAVERSEAAASVRRSARCSTWKARGRRRPDHVDLEQWRHLATLGPRSLRAGDVHGLSLAVRTCGVAHQGHGAQVRIARRQPRDASHCCASASSSSCASRCVRIRAQITSTGPELPVHAHRAADARHARSGRPRHGRQRQVCVRRCTPAISRRACCSGRWCLPAGGALADVPFEIRATDISGQTATFSMPLLFVGKLAEVNKSKEVAEAYNARRASRGKAQRLDGRCGHHVRARRSV